ncbi:MAG: hypothetical protein IJ800_00180 [Clostridia bacterium]|nr:hypothetical protein [Clostridia bacterium]
MNKRIKKSLAVIFGAVLATGIVACSGAEGDNRESVRDSGKIETSPEENTETTKNQSDLNGENSLSSDEGYEGLFAAAMAIADGENFPALSATGNFDFTSYGEGENSQRKLNVQKIGIRADGKMKKAEGKIKGISAKIVISSDDEKEIVFETYLKDGKTYSFTNLFGESYDYDEESSEPEFDFGEMDETDLRNRFNDLKGRIPAPETAKTGDEFTVTWRINGDNIADYYNAFKKAFYAENDDQTEGNEVPSQVEGESGSSPDDETLTQTDGQIRIRTANKIRI